MKTALQLVSPPTPEEERRAKRRRWDAAYYAKHADRAKAAQAKWYQAHKDHVKVRGSAYYVAHKEQVKAYGVTYRARQNPERVKLSKAAWSRLSSYGLTLEAFDVLFAVQDGRCAICRGLLFRDRKTHVDHDHATERVRGLLCHGCNIGLGSFCDSPDTLVAAAKYLRERS